MVTTMQLSSKKFKILATMATVVGAAVGYAANSMLNAEPVRVRASEEFKCVAGGDKYGGQKDDVVFIFQPKGSQKFLMFATAPLSMISTDEMNINTPDLKGDFAAYVDYTRPSLSGAAPLGFISIDKKAGKCDLTVAMTDNPHSGRAQSYRLQGVLALNQR